MVKISLFKNSEAVTYSGIRIPEQSEEEKLFQKEFLSFEKEIFPSELFKHWEV